MCNFGINRWDFLRINSATRIKSPRQIRSVESDLQFKSLIVKPPLSYNDIQPH